MVAGFAAVVVVDVAWAFGVLVKAALMRDEEKLRYVVRDELMSSWKAPLLAGVAAILSRSVCVRSDVAQIDTSVKDAGRHRGA